MFAETSYFERDRRRFSIVANGVTIVDDLDIFASAGYHHRAWIITAIASVTDRQLTLGFVPIKDTAMVNAITALADRGVKFVPEVLVSGSNGSGSLDGLAGTLMRWLGNAGSAQQRSNPPAVASPPPGSSLVAEPTIYPMPPSGK
jgi:hypothetical protein